MVENTAASSGGGFPWAQAIGQGLSGIGSIFDYYAGSEGRAYEEWLRKFQQQMAGQLQGELNVPAVTEGQVMKMQPFMEKGMSGYMNKLAGGASKRLGLDSGAAWGEITRGGQSQMQGQMAELYKWMLGANVRKRQGTLGMLAGMGR